MISGDGRDTRAGFKVSSPRHGARPKLDCQPAIRDARHQPHMNVCITRDGVPLDFLRVDDLKTPFQFGQASQHFRDGLPRNRNRLPDQLINQSDGGFRAFPIQQFVLLPVGTDDAVLKVRLVPIAFGNHATPSTRSNNQAIVGLGGEYEFHVTADDRQRRIQVGGMKD